MTRITITLTQDELRALDAAATGTREEFCAAAVADALARLPLPDDPAGDGDEENP